MAAGVSGARLRELPLRTVIGAAAAVAALMLALWAALPRSGSAVPETAYTAAAPEASSPAGGRSAAGSIPALRAHLAQRPNDARAWVILARLLADNEAFAEAAAAYASALERSAKVAADPAIWCEYADALGMSQGGRLAGKPRAFVERALALKPNHPRALEMAGSSEYERGDYRAALRYWRQLQAELRPDSESHAELSAAIARAERRAATSLPVQQR